MKLDVHKQLEAKMTKTIDALKHEYTTIRAGRANASVLDKIAIDYYGSMTPVQQVGSISSPEPRMLVIQPWDATILKEISQKVHKIMILNPEKKIRWNNATSCVKDYEKIVKNNLERLHF